VLPGIKASPSKQKGARDEDMRYDPSTIALLKQYIGSHNNVSYAAAAGQSPPVKAPTEDDSNPNDPPMAQTCEEDSDPPSNPSEGAEPGYYANLNKKVKKLCWKNPSQCYYVGQYAE